MTAAAPSIGTDHTWPDVLSGLVAGQDLDEAAAAWVMDRVMSGEATAAQIAAVAVGLRAKGEAPGEVAGFAASMLAHAVPVRLDVAAVDIVGTGGDRANTVNISTMASVVVAAAGAPVVKHGNRAASSMCGSADLIEAFGVPLELGADAVARTVAEVGIGFCFAPVFHPSFRHTAGVRRELGIPTIFNFLGPLTNPAQPRAAAIGCGRVEMAPVMAQVFADRGDSVLLFRGDDGLDELTTTTTSTVWRVTGGRVDLVSVDPIDLGIARSTPSDLRGGDVAHNLGVALDVFAGRPGPARDAVVLNAAAALAAHQGLTDDLTADLRSGAVRAASALDSGDCVDLVRRWAALGASLAR